MSTNSLGPNPFPSAALADWRARAGAALKGADFEKRLVGRTADGLRINPLHVRREGAPLVHGARAASRWRIAQRVEHEDPAAFNAAALEELEGGADALVVSFAGSRGARGFGLAPDAPALDEALKGVRLDLIRIFLEPGDGAAAAGALSAAAGARHYEPSSLAIGFGLDPLGGAPALKTMLDLRASGFRGPFFACDARPVHEAGGTEAQEIASLLAQSVAALRLMETAGIAPAAAREAISFVLPLDADLFLGIAKLRALRLAFSRLEEALGLKPRPASIRAESSWRMLARRDAHVNLLRASAACFAAAVGGADAMTVHPFTAAAGLPAPQARRIARNMQLVLMEESNLWRVADPAAGAGSIEALTDALAEKAWSLFQELEREGGIGKSLASGAFPARVAGARQALLKAVATRRLPLTGVSEFPDLAEAPVEPAQPARAIQSGALPVIRLAEPFEALRDAADACRARTGAPPKARLVTFGPLSDHSARLGFARNFFAAGGIEEAADNSPAKLACLCGTDEAYAREAAAAARALSEQGAAVWIAGRPGADEAALRGAGVSGYIHAGCDAVEALGKAHKILGPA